MGAPRQPKQESKPVAHTATVRVHVRMKFRRPGGRKAIVLLNGEPAPPHALSPRCDAALLRALARAYRWQGLTDSGGFSSIQEIAEAEGVTASYVGRLLRLCRLAPWRVQAIIDGVADGGLDLSPGSLLAIPTIWERSR